MYNDIDGNLKAPIEHFQHKRGKMLVRDSYHRMINLIDNYNSVNAVVGEKVTDVVYDSFYPKKMILC
jgi:hypothetical protein